MMMSNLQELLFRAQLTVIDDADKLNFGANEEPTLEVLVNKFLPVAIAIGISAAVVLVAVGGYKMLTSGGDSSKIKDAKEQIQNAILGLILVVAAVTIATIVMNQLGITGLF